MNIDLCRNIVKCYCEQFEVQSRTIRVHGVCPTSDIVDNFLDDGFIFISEINEKGVPIYHVYEVSQGNIQQIPPIYGHSYESWLELFVATCVHQSDCCDEMVLFGLGSFICSLQDGKPLKG